MKLWKWFLFLSLVYAISCPSYLQGKNTKEPTLIVVPARERVIKLAIDIADMRKNVSVVSFRLPIKTQGDPIFFLWDKGKWQPVMYDDFCEMKCLTKLPGKVIVIGETEAIPNSVMNAMPWAEKTIRIPTFVISDIVNQLDGHLVFTEKEWKRLAANHGLILEDLNAEKRKFNPYDIPRSKLPLQIVPATKAEKESSSKQKSSKEIKLQVTVIDENPSILLKEEDVTPKKDEIPPK